MPKVTVYIRKEDYPKWQSIKEKTAFISSALAEENSIDVPEATIENVLRAEIKPKSKPEKICKHGFTKGDCFHKESIRLKCNV